ncbi:MAG TPA: S-adenosylmethionine decarboxylase [Gemmatimonadaceae bacterium]|nr:S-adenosylmethionine decarboxylase [Gemmatimonadaceae bacterium]
MPAPLRHLTAEFHGVPATQLGDEQLLGGLLIAAASAAGFGATEVPLVRSFPDGGVTAVLLLGGCHLVAHAFLDRELLLVDVLAPAARDSQKALDVFARRLTAREVRSEVHERG